MAAARRVEGRPLRETDRLNIPGAVKRRVNAIFKRDEADFPVEPGPIAWINSLLDAGRNEDAALLAWAASTMEGSLQEEMFNLVTQNPRLLHQFDLEYNHDKLDKYAKLRSLTADISAASVLDPEKLERVAQLATSIASELRAVEQNRHARISELETLLAKVVPDTAFDAAKRLQRLDADALEALAQALLSANGTRLALADAEAKVRNAVNDRAYAAVVKFAGDAESLRIGFEQIARQIRDLLGDVEFPDERIEPQEQAAHQDEQPRGSAQQFQAGDVVLAALTEEDNRPDLLKIYETAEPQDASLDSDSIGGVLPDIN